MFRTEAISPRKVRYIKLGRGGTWEKECESRSILRFGFGTSKQERFALCLAGRWEALTQSFIKEGKDQGTATRHTNEARLFFEDDGSTLWITFIGQHLYWGFLAPNPPEIHEDLEGTWRSVVKGWSCKDIEDKPLTKDGLSGAITRLAAYRGTSCGIEKERYLIDRINGKKPPEVERALLAQKELKESLLELIRLLGPKDFELLVDLSFSSSGWRRVGVVGGTQKSIDIDMVLPSTEERAFVQVKSRGTSKEFQEEYLPQLKDGHYQRAFFVFHTGEVTFSDFDDSRVTLIGPEQMAKLVLDAGLTTWIINKVS